VQLQALRTSVSLLPQAFVVVVLLQPPLLPLVLQRRQQVRAPKGRHG
jgi:hypothetical protein